MTEQFGRYAEYYDLLYGDKDYASEAAYVAARVEEHAPGAKSILELGCGTGVHAALLSRRGYHVHGIEASSAMLHRAEQLHLEVPEEGRGTLDFALGDVRSWKGGRLFDAVVSLFHVVSYQTTNDDLVCTFETAAAHLGSGGLFMFDCWYGPAVLTQRPAVRVKRMENALMTVTRIAEPLMDVNQNRVDVHYQVFIRDRLSGKVEVVEETHRMRYLFAPEIEALLAAASMDVLASEEWMSGQRLGCDTWSACFMARRR